MKPKLVINPALFQEICFAGNLNIDLIIRNIAHFPAWGQEVIGSGYSVVSSGQSAYSAFALRGLGVPVSIIGNVGDDLYGRMIISDLQQAGVDTSAVSVTPGGQTGISIAVVRPDGERAFISDTACLSAFTREMVLAQRQRMQQAGLLCFVGSFFLPGLPIQHTAQLLKTAKEMQRVTMLDTGWDANNWQPETVSQLRQALPHVDIFLPNLDEAAAITGLKKPEEALDALLSDGAESVIIKMGAEGCLTRTKEGYLHVPVYPVQVVDAVGAGDVFNAGYLLGCLQGWPVRARLLFGSVTAALYISRSANRFPSLAQVESALNDWALNPYLFEELQHEN